MAGDAGRLAAVAGHDVDVMIGSVAPSLEGDPLSIRRPARAFVGSLVTDPSCPEAYPLPRDHPDVLIRYVGNQVSERGPGRLAGDLVTGDLIGIRAVKSAVAEYPEDRRAAGALRIHYRQLVTAG